MGAAELLRLSNLNKWYDGLHALQDVSLTISEGEVVALVGDNGAGKSTLVKIIAGAQTADSGEIALRGEIASVKSP